MTTAVCQWLISEIGLKCEGCKVDREQPFNPQLIGNTSQRIQSMIGRALETIIARGVTEQLTASISTPAARPAENASS